MKAKHERYYGLKDFQTRLSSWEEKEVRQFVERKPELIEEFMTYGKLPLKRVYTALDTEEIPLEDIGLPGQYPFTRGPYPTMYRTAADHLGLA